MDDFVSFARGPGAEDVWPDLNPVEMVEHFAKFEHYDENAPLSDLGSLERQLDWSAKLSLAELEEFFEPNGQTSSAAQPQQPQVSVQHAPPPAQAFPDRELHDDVRVTLLHRTRNAQGCEWQVVASKEEIRVTRNRGKLFKVVVESSAPFTRNDVHLFLADSSVSSLSSSPTHGISSYDSSSSSSSPSTSPPASSPLQLSAHDLVVQSIDEVQPSKTTTTDGRPTSYSVEVKVKLCLIGKGIQIAARISPPNRHASVGRSVEFMTHNNGKQKLRTEAKKKKTTSEKETPTKRKRTGSKVLRGGHASEDQAGTAAVAGNGLKIEPDTGAYDQSDMRTTTRGSTDYTGESPSSASDEDDIRHVPLVAPSFYTHGEVQPPTHHHVATHAPPIGQPHVSHNGFQRNETPDTARRQFGMTNGGVAQRGSMIDAGGEMDIGRVTVVGAPPQHSVYPGAGAMGMETDMGMTMGMGHGATDMDGGIYMPNGGYGSMENNAEDLSDYGRGEPMLASGLLNRKRKMDGAHGGNGSGDGGRRSSAPYPDHLSIQGGLHVEGIVRAQGFMQYSDLRLKTNVEDIVDAVSLISRLQGKRYRWKSQEEVQQLTGKTTPISLQNNGGLKVIGLIAQQVQQVLPEVVREDEDGFLSVDYVEIIPVLIEAFNQHLESYHREQKELKGEFDSWRRLLGDKDTVARQSSSGAVIKELIRTKKTTSKSKDATRQSGSNDNDIEAARSVTDDEEPDSLDRSSVTTDEDTEEYRHSTSTADLVETAAEEQSLLAVDLDRLVSNKYHLASLAAQMNKLIPDRQYTDLLKYMRDQRKIDTKRNRRLFFLFVFACLALFAINIVVSIGVPYGITYIAESHI